MPGSLDGAELFFGVALGATESSRLRLKLRSAIKGINVWAILCLCCLRRCHLDHIGAVHLAVARLLGGSYDGSAKWSSSPRNLHQGHQEPDRVLHPGRRDGPLRALLDAWR